MRGPFTEDHSCDGDKALAADSSRHKLGHDGKCHGCAAQTCQKSGNDDTDVADLVDVDTKRIRSSRMLTDRAQMQTPFGPVEDPDHENGQDQRQNGRHIHVEVVETSLKTFAAKEFGYLVGDGMCLCRAFKENSGQEESKTRSDQVHGYAADSLVCLACHRGKGMAQSEDRARDPGADKAQPGVTGIVTDRGTRESTDRHHAFDSDVDDTGDLGNDTALRSKDHRR